MADLSQSLESFPDLEHLVESVGPSLSPNDLDGYLKVKDFQVKSYHLRTFLEVWKEQQNQDRNTRKYYAKWLLVFVGVQIVIINILFILLGLGILRVEKWTSNTFIVSVFAEISAMVLVVVNYLFPKEKGSANDLFAILKREGSR